MILYYSYLCSYYFWWEKQPSCLYAQVYCSYIKTTAPQVSIVKHCSAPYWRMYNTVYFTLIVMHIFDLVPSFLSIHSVHIIVKYYSHTLLSGQF